MEIRCLIMNRKKRSNFSLTESIKKNITTIIIGNRLNIIKNSDKIYALKGGKVVEEGTHDELMAKNGYYKSLIKSEIKKEIFGTKDTKELAKENLKKQMTIKFSSLFGQTMRYELGKEDEEEIQFKMSKIFALVKEKKLILFFGILAGIIYGVYIPSISLILGKLTTSFALKNNSDMKKKVMIWAWVLFGIVLVGNVANYFKVLNLSQLGANVVSKTRKALYKKFLELHMGFYDFESNTPSGLLSTLSIDVNNLRLFFSTIIGATTVTGGTIITALIIGLIYDWKLTLILFCFFPFRIAFTVLSGIYRFGGKRKYKEIRIEAGSFFTECVTNTKTIFSYNFQNKAITMYKSILDRETKDYIKNSLILSALIGAGDFLSYASNSVAYKFAMIFIRHKSLTFSTMNNVKKTLMSYIEGTDLTIRGISDYSRVKVAYKSIYNILNTETEINPFEEANQDKKVSPDFKGKIEFRNVTFAYPTKPQSIILRNLSFVIPPGKKVALVGNSESGKSTIIQLIERFYDVYKGEVLIDNINIKEYNLYDLRKKIGLISQEPVIFKRSIYDNILYGNLDANPKQVQVAANKANIMEYLNIESSQFKEHSSEGQKQKISIARIMLKNPSVVLLDNATASLDKDSEKEVRKSIFDLQQGKTSISITHRLSDIINYDIIFYMEKGKIVEQGTHDELLGKRGKYYNLYHLSEK